MLQYWRRFQQSGLERLLCIILLPLLAALPAHAACDGENQLAGLDHAAQVELEALVAQHPYPKGNLWRAQKGRSSIHIMGTMHINDPRLGLYLARFWPIVDRAELILLEATRETMAELQAAMTTDPSLMFITDGPTLPEQMSADDWAALSAAMSARGIPAFMTGKMQPWYVSMMLSIPPCAMAEIAAQNGVDHKIMARAAERHIPTSALESYDTVFALFNSEPAEDQLDMLHMALTTADDGADMITTLVDAYLDGEHRKIWEFSRLLAQSTPGYSSQEMTAIYTEMEAGLLIGRNRNWMDVILPAAAENDNLLVAVGAAHLSGESGVLNLLEQAGYSLSRVPLQ